MIATKALLIGISLLICSDLVSADMSQQKTMLSKEKRMEIVRKEADIVLESQAPNGAITMTPVKDRIIPYFANFAAVGLIRAGVMTKDRHYLDAARRHLDWYASAMQPNGIVCDYELKEGKLQSTGKQDSTDSYAATYLAAAWEYYSATKDKEWLTKKKTSFVKALNAIVITLQPDGLTYATPTYHVKYLMDNLEVWQGLKAGARLLKSLGDTKLEKKFLDYSVTTRRALAKYWIPEKGYFSMAMFEDGKLDQDFDKWYPHGMANAMAAGILLDPNDKESKDLVEKVLKAFPGGADWVWWVAAQKFSFKAEASNALEKMVKDARYSMDHSQIIRAMAWDSEHLFFMDHPLSIKELGK